MTAGNANQKAAEIGSIIANEDIDVMKFERCEVGMFRLPGLTINKESYDPDLHQQQVEWAQENNCGTAMTEYLWSFKNEKQRDWFILRWYE